MTSLAQEHDVLSKYGILDQDLPEAVVDNLAFVLRKHQKEALARLFYCLNEYQGRGAFFLGMLARGDEQGAPGTRTIVDTPRTHV